MRFPRAILLALPLLLAIPARAETRILTFGGGGDPTHNQVSLESNVIYLQKVLGDLGLAGIRHDIYFADGAASQHCLEYTFTPTPQENLQEQIAQIFVGDGNRDVRFRGVNIPQLLGPSTPANLSKWMASDGAKMKAGDKLLFYFTGHGGPGATDRTAPRGEVPRNTTMDMWGMASGMPMRNFALQLDQLDPGVEVTLLMVQCHSGGFANVIYTGGDPAKGIDKHLRCGFFATTAPRLAAGCTPDVDEEDYKEFSTPFFAALCGTTRKGQAIEKPDYDHDGVVSYTEAFTYVLLTSDTIDLPMTTSDQLLRDKSRYKEARDDASVLPNTVPYTTILDASTPAQKAALEGLSKILNLTGDDRLTVARDLGGQITQQRRQAQKRMRQAVTDYENARLKMRNALARHWPELDIPWHPDVPAILEKEGPQIQKFMESLSPYADMTAAARNRDDLMEQDYQLERKWIKVQRFIDRAQTVILAANLPKVAGKDVVAFYQDLVRRENETLGK